MKKKVISLILFLANIFCAVLFAQSNDVRFESDLRISQEAAASFEMDAQMFAYIGLVASGASDEKIQAHLNSLDAAFNEFYSDLNKKLSNEEKADLALQFIYKKFISKYKFEQTCVDVAMEQGVYNCVSSDIIFMYFAKRMHIPVVAVETPKHAFCTIESNGVMIDVETTNPFGVNPGKKRTSQLPNGGKQYLTVPAKDYQGRHDIDDRRLLAIVYQNRISVLQKRKLNAATIGLAVDACALQANSQIGLHQVAECVCNYASDLTKAGKDQEGLVLVLQAQELFGETKNYTVYIEAANYNILVDKIENLSLDSALSEVYAKKDLFSAKNYNGLIVYIYGKNSQIVAEKGDWPKAIQIVERGLKEMPNEPNLKKSLNIYKQNYAIEFHNRAADLFNKGDKAGAREIIKQGLLLIPDSSVLKNDLNRMK